ncbi:MAG: NADP-dependent malic enzyme [Spirochaetota bacterium]|nr:NADP-dependent malic enzyme [Spirochaetota bacterium]
MSTDDPIHDLHRGGKLSVESRVALSPDTLAMAYTPGVAEVCRTVARDPASAWDFTIKGTSIAVVTDGSAVLGLGNIGPLAALPVMEGKAALFRVFGGVNAYPICLDTQDAGEIIQCVKHLAPIFGGINLEDISAPRCFEIEERLDAELSIPVFHDDQHGTAIVVLAALENALRLRSGTIANIRVAISGAGAAGIAIAGILTDAGVGELVLCDSRGIVSRGRADLNPYKQKFAASESGGLTDAVRGADVFIGVSAPAILTSDMVQTMRPRPIIFALSNPTPEIMPEELQGSDAIIATGRSDYPNQINNVLAFPGVFKGALSARLQAITPAMRHKAARALASLVADQELASGRIIPSVFDPRVAGAVAAAVCEV